MGQGIISFANGTTTRISTNGVVQPVGAPGTWYYALFRAPSTKNTINTQLDPLYDGWTLVAIGTNVMTVSGGRLSGNTTTEGVVVTPNGPSTDDYAVAGWSGNLGPTWLSVEEYFNNQPVFSEENHEAGPMAGVVAYFGIAPTIADNIIAQPTGAAINGIFGTGPGLIHGFSLNYPVPEPSIAAFLTCGGGVWLLSRRRTSEKMKNKQ